MDAWIDEPPRSRHALIGRLALTASLAPLVVVVWVAVRYASCEFNELCACSRLLCACPMLSLVALALGSISRFRLDSARLAVVYGATGLVTALLFGVAYTGFC